MLLQNHLYKKDTGDARHVPGASWDPGNPLGPPGTPLGPQGTPLDFPETPLGPPENLQGSLVDHKDTHISTNIQRQQLSIAVFEPACQGPSHEALVRAALPIKKAPK